VKVGVVGVGAVGAATALSLIERGGICRELVVVDRKMERANGVATDLRYTTPLSPTVDVRAGNYDALEVLLWSSASVGGVRVLELLGQGGRPVDELRQAIEDDIRYANITIIEGTGASQYGIGAVSARLAEAVLRDERAVLPVAAYSPRYEVTLSLVSVLGAGGVQQLHEPAMTSDERAALERSAAALRQAAHRVLAVRP
jgi:malate/lactate dehydrogenase